MKGALDLLRAQREARYEGPPEKKLGGVRPADEPTEARSEPTKAGSRDMLVEMVREVQLGALAGEGFGELVAKARRIMSSRGGKARARLPKERLSDIGRKGGLASGAKRRQGRS